jgi:hypothetical protein
MMLLGFAGLGFAFRQSRRNFRLQLRDIRLDGEIFPIAGGYPLRLPADKEIARSFALSLAHTRDRSCSAAISR